MIAVVAVLAAGAFFRLDIVNNQDNSYFYVSVVFITAACALLRVDINENDEINCGRVLLCKQREHMLSVLPAAHMLCSGM